MKVITCASYYGTGSSAVIDFFSEFNNVHSLTNYEFRFLQDPDGIVDLEYNLVENHNRHNSGHALKRFKRLVDFNAGTFFNKRYEPFFSNKYKELSYEYIKELTDFTFKGYWFYDFYDKGRFLYYLVRLPEKILSILHGNSKDVCYINLLPNEITYCSRPSSEKFIKTTKEYINKLCDAANFDNKEYILFDQIVPPSNVSKYTKFFDDIKVIVVDRDPRDIYISSQIQYHDHILPYENVELFCKWYRYIREHRLTEKYDDRTTLLIKFEDLIYNYDKTTKKLIDFVGIDEKYRHDIKNKFNPNVSIKNTKLWLKYQEFVNDIKYIESYLTEFLYS